MIVPINLSVVFLLLTTTAVTHILALDQSDDQRATYLHEFLNKYSGSASVPPGDSTSDEPPQGNKQKSWNLLSFQKHHHNQHHQSPYDDKKGWVTMEPVPWSSSKISKWQSNQQSSVKPIYDRYDNVLHSDSIYSSPQPSKFHVEYNGRPKPYQPHYHHNHEGNCNKYHDQHGDIITDNAPPNFPQYNQYETRRRASGDLAQYPENHPFNGNGEWVLVSTTKGYKQPQQRQRSLKINAGGSDMVKEDNDVSTHRGVRLTVLPPLKNSKVNMTTSHGGLLQVESTFQTVEQAVNKHRMNKNKKKARPALGTQEIQLAAANPLSTRTDPSGSDASAVLAAVGAGMIPATMAMLVPVAMNGRKRRRRQIQF